MKKLIFWQMHQCKNTIIILLMISIILSCYYLLMFSNIRDFHVEEFDQMSLVERIELEKMFTDNSIYSRNTISFYQHLLDNNIELYNHIKEHYYLLDSSTSVSNFVNIQSNVIPIVFPFLVLIFSFLIMNRNDKQRYYTRLLPYTNNQIYLSKISCIVICNFIIYLASQVFVFIVSGNIGSLHYPIVCNTLFLHSTTQIIIPFYQYLIFVMMLQFVHIVILTLLYCLILSLTKYKWINLFVTMLLPIYGSIYFLSLEVPSTANIIPYIFDNSHVLLTHGQNLIVYFGIVTIVSIVCYVAVIAFDTRRD